MQTGIQMHGGLTTKSMPLTSCLVAVIWKFQICYFSLILNPTLIYHRFVRLLQFVTITSMHVYAQGNHCIPLLKDYSIRPFFPHPAYLVSISSDCTVKGNIKSSSVGRQRSCRIWCIPLKVLLSGWVASESFNNEDPQCLKLEDGQMITGRGWGGDSGAIAAWATSLGRHALSVR